MNKKTLNLKLLESVCFASGAPGFEVPIRSLVQKNLKGLADEISVDAMGNLIAFKRGLLRDSVMMAAHLDELGFMVNHIDDQGFIRLTPLGGYDPKTLSSQRVLIHGTKEIKGVLGTKPVHKMSAEEREKAPQIKDYFVDTGYRKKDLEKLVSLGDSVTRRGDLEIMGDCVCAKSLDNRVGVFILLEALKVLRKKTLPWDLYAVFTVQEEVGLRGAMVAAHNIKPKIGIGLDTTVAFDTPEAQVHEAGTYLGAGVGIKALDSGSICDPRLVKFLTSVAQKQNINHQVAVVTGGSNDTAAIQAMVSGGAITGTICIPTRHIHQSVEMCHKQDILDTINLVTHSLLSLDEFEPAFI